MKTKKLRNLKANHLIKQCLQVSDIILLCNDAGMEALDLRDQIVEMERFENELTRRAQWN